jgi:hypothetical protein
MDPHTDYLAHLEAILEMPPPGADGPRHPFVVDNDDKADWVCRKMAQLRAAMAARTAYVQRETARLAEWHACEDHRDQQALDFFINLLHGYLLALADAGQLGRRRSYRLPHGVLKWRTAPLKWVRNDEVLLRWARTLGLVRILETPDWGAIRTRLTPSEERIGAEAIDTATGEIVPGVQVELPARDTFAVETLDATEGK